MRKKISVASILNLFGSSQVGTKVIDLEQFRDALDAALETYTFPEDGKGFIPMPDALPYVSCGVTRRKNVPMNGYVAREHRGEVILCAYRRYATEASSLNVVIYTADAYKREVNEEEAIRIDGENAEYVLIAVLASAGESKPPVSSHRFVRNLAGGNNRYSPDNGYTLEEAIKEAKAVSEYEAEWITVSD